MIFTHSVLIADLFQEKAEVEAMGKVAMWDLVQRLQAGLHAREKQLERQGQQLANMQEVQQQLQVRRLDFCNEHILSCLWLTVTASEAGAVLSSAALCKLHISRAFGMLLNENHKQADQRGLDCLLVKGSTTHCDSRPRRKAVAVPRLCWVIGVMIQKPTNYRTC